jgi:hypothetical protein
MKRLQWVWCYAAYKLYIWLPVGSDHKNLYGRFQMWLLGYGGAYAHSEDYRYFCEHVTF